MTRTTRRLSPSRRQRRQSTTTPGATPLRRVSQPAYRRPGATYREHPSLEGVIGAAFAFPLGYFIAEGLMNDNRHPIHWMITVAVAVLGYLAGYTWYRWRAG